MLGALLFALIALWFLGFINLPILPLTNTTIITLFGVTISLYDIFIFFVVVWLIGILPGPFRIIASILLVLWLLATFSLISFSGVSISSVIVLVIIFSLIYYLLTKGH